MRVSVHVQEKADHREVCLSCFYEHILTFLLPYDTAIHFMEGPLFLLHWPVVDRHAGFAAISKAAGISLQVQIHLQDTSPQTVMAEPQSMHISQLDSVDLL